MCAQTQLHGKAREAYIIDGMLPSDLCGDKDETVLSSDSGGAEERRRAGSLIPRSSYTISEPRVDLVNTNPCGTTKHHFLNCRSHGGDLMLGLSLEATNGAISSYDS